MMGLKIWYNTSVLLPAPERKVMCYFSDKTYRKLKGSEVKASGAYSWVYIDEGENDERF